MMQVENMVNGRGNFVPNQFVIRDAEAQKVTFQSYQSTIVEIDHAQKVIKVFPCYDYSMTTAKYRNLFMDNLGFYEMSTTKGFETALKKGQVLYRGVVYTIEKVEEAA